jgi:hypothetical protein
MIGYWNDEEDAALQGLSLEAQIIYLRGIRRFADKNGVAGIERRINRASLSEVCHAIPDRGSRNQSSKPTWDQVRRRLDELERAGLIIRRDNMVFDLPLAIADKSAQMRMTRGRHDDDTVLMTRTETMSGNSFDGVADPMMTRGRHADDDTTSPVTNHHINTLSNARAKNATVVPMKRPIPEDFRVSSAVMSWSIHRGHGDPTPHLDHFINTCRANGYQYADHDAAFKKAIADDWAGLRKPENQSNAGRGRKSAPDNNDTSWFTPDLMEPAK